MKYGPQFPERFGSVSGARRFMNTFTNWYNHEHRHTGVVLDDRRSRADRAGIPRRQRKRRLRGHHGHRPPTPDRQQQLSIISHEARDHDTTQPETRRSNHKNTDRDPDSMSGVLGIGRPPPLPPQRLVDHLYTLNCEKPYRQTRWSHDGANHLKRSHDGVDP
ncbi:hypothetical protein [Mycolicibacterium doricum]|uniref:hypothetical protein n=1 Tax=Mycolicibacterium doricum TaxID=126673 RepID=UPI0035564E79